MACGQVGRVAPKVGRWVVCRVGQGAGWLACGAALDGRIFPERDDDLWVGVLRSAERCGCGHFGCALSIGVVRWLACGQGLACGGVTSKVPCGRIFGQVSECQWSCWGFRAYVSSTLLETHARRHGSRTQAKERAGKNQRLRGCSLSRSGGGFRGAVFVLGARGGPGKVWVASSNGQKGGIGNTTTNARFARVGAAGRILQQKNRIRFLAGPRACQGGALSTQDGES